MKRPRAAGRRRAAACLLLAALLGAGAAASSASGLTEAQRRGRRIYEEGRGRAPIVAVLSGTGVEAPGAAFPCVGCHTEDGSGAAEGGVRSADIAWATLTKDFAGARRTGRAHPPYDGNSLRAAITAGRDPAGQPLNEAHPRFRIGADDLSDLVSYLRVLGSVPVPGVSDNEVRIGILLPESGPLAGAGAEARLLLSGWFAEVNARGGIFRRSLALVPVPFDPGVAGSAADAARRAVEREELFCFLANLGVPLEDGAARFLAEAKVPVIVPLLTAHTGGFGSDRYTFHALAGLSDQGRVMVDFLAAGPERVSGRIGLLYAEDGSGRSGADGVREQARKLGIPVAVEIPFPPGRLSPALAVERLRGHGTDAVAYFGGGQEFVALLAEAGRREWRPAFIAPAPLVGGSVPAAAPGTTGPVFLTSPLPAPDAGTEGAARLAGLERRLGLSGEHRSFRLLACAGALALEEGLRRTGRALTREKLVSRMGTFYAFRTGVVPPLTYNENRRVGSRGASIVRVGAGAGGPIPVRPWAEPQ